MGVNIGPKIGIDGEAEFRAQINQMSQQLKTFGTELKAVASGFSDGEKSLESYSAQNEVLNRAIETQEKRLEELKKGLQASAQVYGENDTKTLKWAQAVNNATADLNKLKNQVKENDAAMEALKSGTQEAADAMDEAGQSASGFGDILKGSLAANVIGSTVSGIKDSIIDLGKSLAEYSAESENATKKATAYFGETGEAAKQTEQVIKDVYTGGVGESLDAVADAVITVKNNLEDLSDTDLKNITNQAITLDELYGIDMNETLRGVNSLMEQFGLDAQTAMDYIVAGTQNGLDKTQELGDNLSEYAGKFSQAGYSAEEYFQLLENGLDGGAYNLDKVNDAINEVTTKLSDGTLEEAIGLYSKETQNLFKEWQNGEATQKEVIDSIVSDISRAETQQEALTMAATAFGTMAEDGNLKFIESLTTVGSSYDNVAGKAQAMFDATTTSQQTLDSALRTAQEQLSPIGDKIMEIATATIPQMSTAFMDFVNFTQENGPLLLGIIVAIGTAFLGWNIASILSGVSSALGTMKTAILAVNTAMAANPIGAVITVLAALVAGIVTFIATNDEARAKLIEVWNTIKSTVMSAIQAAVKAFEDFKAKASEIAGNIADSISNLASNIGQKAKEIGNSIINGIQTGVNFVKELPGKFLTWGKDMINNMVKGIKSGISAVGDAVKAVADKISSFLHFSEPDVGPLSKFHTFMPDMTDLMVKGIRAGIPDVKKAVNDLSEVMVPTYANGTAAQYERMAAQMGNMQIVLSDGTLVGKLSPKIDATLGGYAKIKGRYYT